MTTSEKTTISQKTLLPLSLVIMLCGGVVWISSQLSGINYKLDELEKGMQDNWTGHDMENWALRLKLVNPSIIIPEPDSNHPVH